MAEPVLAAAAPAANMGLKSSPRFFLDLLAAAVEAMMTPFREEREVMAVASFSLLRILLPSREVLPVMARVVLLLVTPLQDQAVVDRADPF